MHFTTYKHNIDFVLGNETGTQDFPLQVHGFSVRLESWAHTVPTYSVLMRTASLVILGIHVPHCN